MKKTILDALWLKIKNTFIKKNSDASLTSLSTSGILVSSGIAISGAGITMSNDAGIVIGSGISISGNGITASNIYVSGTSISGGNINIGSGHIYGHALNIGSGYILATGSGSTSEFQNIRAYGGIAIGSGTITQGSINIGSGYIEGSGLLIGSGGINVKSGAVFISGGGITLGSGISITGSGFYLNEYGFGTSGFYCSGAQANFSNGIMLYSGSINLQGSSGSINFGSSYLKIKGYTGATGSGMTTMSNIVIDSSNKLEVPMITSLPYSQLVSLKYNNQLVKGRQYRIIDYTTTTSQANTKSAGHAFNIIVTADDTNKLNENAKAIGGGTYFANSNLLAWEIKYCLDNDTNKFAWADSTNGKGVIYYMKDEFNNECPYDFKNIQYVFVQGFTVTYNTYGIRTKIYGRKSANDQTINGTKYYGWTKVAEPSSGGVDLPNDYWTTTLTLSTSMNRYVISNGTATLNTAGNIAETNSNDLTTYTFDYMGQDASILILQNVYNNIIKEYINHDNNKQELNIIYFNNNAGTALKAYNNVFSTDCHHNYFRYYCYSNTFGNNCHHNYFGSGCNSNTFGNNCYSNTLGSSCYSNTFGNDCYSNTFGGNCNSNNFKNNCYFNTFGGNCNSNNFGNACFSNTFGNNCYYNIFGNGCGPSTFENYCYYNIFENYCNNITFYKQYTLHVTVENGNRQITLTSTQTTSSSNLLKNITIAQGVGTTSTFKTISHNTVNDTFKTTYQPVDSQTISV